METSQEVKVPGENDDYRLKFSQESGEYSRRENEREESGKVGYYVSEKQLMSEDS